jgi:hypothetical protein
MRGDAYRTPRERDEAWISRTGPVRPVCWYPQTGEKDLVRAG